MLWISWRLRRFVFLLRRCRTSLALRGFRGTLARAREIVVRRPAAPDRTLALLPLNEPFEPFALPVAIAPRVSVIVPVHGQLAHTLACLHSIALHGAKAPFEVVVVDDASPDDSAATLARIDGLRRCETHATSASSAVATPAPRSHVASSCCFSTTTPR
jgi:hypothetical protein